MKLRLTRDKLIKNVCYWRGNVERQLAQAPTAEQLRIQKLIADLVLIEKALREPFSQQFDVEYNFPDAERIIKKSGGPLWLRG